MGEKQVDDLKIIKKCYGEKMMHLCRELFPSILETPGFLSKLMLEHFQPSRFLYDDLVRNKVIEDFKNYIFSLILSKERKLVDTGKTPFELLEEKGYILYECSNEEDIQSFKKYFAFGEELCTFKGDRLDTCHVFFAVKKNVDDIRREDFKNPSREDEYGTSVISIQFRKGNTNTVSIKNRYNHTVKNPDNTFNNNLENIIPGLSASFIQYYGYNFDVVDDNMEIPNYVNVNGKYYKYNYEINNVYYCPNNIIIKNFKVIDTYAKEPERYIVLDYFIIDLKEKNIYSYAGLDTFGNEFKNIDGSSSINKICISKDKNTGEKTLKIVYDNGSKAATIIIDKYNRMVEYHNEYLTVMPYDYLSCTNHIKKISLPNLQSMGSRCLVDALELTEFRANNLKTIRDTSLYNVPSLTVFEANELTIMGNYCLFTAGSLESFEAENLQKMGHRCLCWVTSLKRFKTNGLRNVGRDCLKKSQFKRFFNEEGMVEFVLLNPENELLSTVQLPSPLSTKLNEMIVNDQVVIGKFHEQVDASVRNR